MSVLTYFFFGLAGATLLVLLFCASAKAIEASLGDAPRVWIVIALLAWGGVFGLGLAAIDSEPSGPCLRYTTGATYNPATKTVMPYRTCAERGEWVEDPA